jgi:hypothetical protein
LENQLVVRVLFSAGGFEAGIQASVNMWNQEKPIEPIILISPTQKLFGKMLCASLVRLALGKLTNTGKTKIEDYFPLFRPLSSDCNLLSQDDFRPNEGEESEEQETKETSKKRKKV